MKLFINYYISIEPKRALLELRTFSRGNPFPIKGEKRLAYQVRRFGVVVALASACFLARALCVLGNAGRDRGSTVLVGGQTRLESLAPLLEVVEIPLGVHLSDIRLELVVSSDYEFGFVGVNSDLWSSYSIN